MIPRLPDPIRRIAPGFFLFLAVGAPAAPWTSWTKHPANPVYTHSTVASDPSVLKDGSTYRMVVSGAGGVPGRRAGFRGGPGAGAPPVAKTGPV